jgi:hypothetical protein
VLPEQGQWPGWQSRSSSAGSWRQAVASCARFPSPGHSILPVGGGYSPARVATAHGAAARRVVATVTLGFIPAITPGAVGGFLIGIVLSAVCCVLLIAYHGEFGRPRPPADRLTMPDLYIAAPGVSPFGFDSAGTPATASFGERAGPPRLDVAERVGHGLDQRAPASWRHFAQRSPGRHAAPSAGIGVGPMAAKFAVRPLPVRF